MGNLIASTYPYHLESAPPYFASGNITELLPQEAEQVEYRFNVRSGTMLKEERTRAGQTIVRTEYKRSANTPGVSLTNHLGLRWELFPVINVFSARNKVEQRLYHAFGEVEAVDHLNGRLLIRLLESPIAHTVVVPFEKTPYWLRHVGQGFEAQATLSQTDPNVFSIGEFVREATEEHSDYASVLRDLAEASHEFRF